MNPDFLRVVIVSPRNPLNIGAAARAMSNFGFRHLRLVNPYHVAYHEARSAVNADEILQSLRQRMGNDPATELKVAAAEQRKISKLRLEQLVK